MKNLIKNIKNYLIKKVTLTDIYTDKYFLVINLKLQNFYLAKKDILVLFNDQKELATLPFEYNDNSLVIKCPFSLLESKNNKADIELYINGEKMWIKNSDNVKMNNNKTVIIRGKYLKVNAKKKNNDN